MENTHADHRSNTIADLDRYIESLPDGHRGVVVHDVRQVQQTLAAGHALTADDMRKVRIWLRSIAADDAGLAHEDFAVSHKALGAAPENK